MKAVGFLAPLEINNPESLLDLQQEKPKLSNPRDILVQVKGVSVNPVDYKIRRSAKPQNGEAKIIGWDASGIVTEVGSAVTNFKVGDEVYYAGEINRQGSNADFQLVDERIVAKKPKSLNFETAAALPLTSLTAYESLFDRLEVQKDATPEVVLIIGAAGGVGSIAIQMLKALTKHKVVATASRPESQAWCKEMGADHVIDHSKNLTEQYKALDIREPKYVFGLNHTESYLVQIAEIIRPQGKLCLIDDPKTLDINMFKRKSVSVHWELMFTRSLFQTQDISRQHEILSEVAALVDAKKITATATKSMGPMNAANLRAAHAILESGRATGKLTLSND